MRPDLQDALSRIHPKDAKRLSGWERAFEVVPTNERILGVISGVCENSAGPLIVTDRHLIHSGLMGGQIVIPVSDVYGSRYTTYGIVRKPDNLFVMTAAGELRFGLPHVSLQSMDPFMAALNQAKEQLAAMTIPASAPPASKADELAKLADLRDRGVLTDAEFAEQKAALLD